MNAEFEEWLNTLPPNKIAYEDIPQYIDHMMHKAYLAGMEAQKRKDVEIVEKHHVSTSDLTGYGFDEWGYDVDIAEAIERSE